MKAKELILVGVLMMLALSLNANAVWVESGDSTLYRQPNGANFRAHYWGDEFEWHMETVDGYAIIRKDMDGYYYYATLDTSGDYTWTNLKVAIDVPVGSPHLRRTEPAWLALLAMREGPVPNFS